MSTTEVRCLQTSTHLLGTVLHLDDVIGTFAGRQIAALSDSLPFTLLSVAARVAVTAALLFIEFGVLLMYSPLITGTLIIGMYFYPVPEQTIAPIRPPLPPVGAEPAPLISGSLPDIIYLPEEPASPVRPPAPPTATTTPTSASTTPSNALTSSITRSSRPPELVRRTLFGTTPQAAPGTLLSTSLISQSSPREVPQADMFRSVVVSSSPAVVTPHRRSNSAGSLPISNLGIVASHDDEEEDSSSASNSPPASPPPERVTLIPPAAAAVAAASTSTLTHRRVPSAAFSPGSVVDNSIQSHQGAPARDFLIVLFTQALGDDLGPFFVNNMLPPNITTSQFNPLTRNFLFTFSAPKEATISRVGPNAIAGVQGCSLKIQSIVHGKLDEDMRGITFDENKKEMQMSGTWTTVTLTGLRRNFDESITLKGSHWVAGGDIKGTADQFRDTFSYIRWNP